MSLVMKQKIIMFILLLLFCLFMTKEVNDLHDSYTAARENNKKKTLKEDIGLGYTKPSIDSKESSIESKDQPSKDQNKENDMITVTHNKTGNHKVKRFKTIIQMTNDPGLRFTKGFHSFGRFYRIIGRKGSLVACSISVRKINYRIDPFNKPGSVTTYLCQFIDGLPPAGIVGPDCEGYYGTPEVLHQRKIFRNTAVGLSPSVTSEKIADWIKDGKQVDENLIEGTKAYVVS